MYEEALSVELTLRGIQHANQVIFSLRYKDRDIGEGRIALLIEDELIVELKAVESLAPIHSAQVISYLKALNKELALLINFNERLLKNGIKRVVLPEKNRQDVAEIPDELLRGLDLQYVRTIEEALSHTLNPVQ